MARRYVRAAGAPFSDEDAPIIGRELQKIADAHQVGDLRQLDKKLVFGIVEANPRHPLRRFYNWDVAAAARRHWLDCTAVLIRSIHVEVRVGRMQKQVSMFSYAEAPTNQARTHFKRTRVLTEDLLRNDPAFSSAVGFNIRRINDALRTLENLTSCRRVSPELRGLCTGALPKKPRDGHLSCAAGDPAQKVVYSDSASTVTVYSGRAIGTCTPRGGPNVWTSSRYDSAVQVDR
jgi:hypothetical protein